MSLLEKIKKINVGVKFLIGVVIVYFLIAIFNQNIFLESIAKFLMLFKSIILNLVLVFVIMFLFNLFFKEKTIKKFFKSAKNWKKYLLAIVFGIISSGPIYVWYPFLADLKEQGMSNGLIATFLYNRAIKLPLLPIMIYYFSLKIVLLLSFFMIMFSIINGLIINKLLVIKQK